MRKRRWRQLDKYQRHIDKTRIYLVTVMESPFGKKRTWGYFLDLAVAQHAVEHNSTDIHEGSYNYALIERAYEGIVPICQAVGWYKFNLSKGMYEAYPAPLGTEQICNWGIG